MNIEAFDRACQRIRDGNQQSMGIGTMGEKTLHAVLKYSLEPREENHEIPVGGFVADIVGETGIIEIQTAGFDRLRKKLTAFLPLCDVTVVYPIAAVKWLCWIDPETGSISQRRKSPRRGKPQDACNELYKIRSFLSHPRLHFRFVLLELEEYRYQNGWGNDGKRGSSRCDRLPLSFLGEVVIHTAEDYRQLLPPALPMPFTTADFRKVAGVPPKAAQNSVYLLHQLGVIRRIGKQGRSFLYETAEKKQEIGDVAQPPASQNED